MTTGETMNAPTDDNNRTAVAGPVERQVRHLVKWRTGWRHDIERVECSKETAKCVWHIEACGKKHIESRHDKMGSGWQYHDSWDLAHAYLTKLAEQKLFSSRRTLELAQAFAGNVKGLRKPPDA
jgi:hypothetical protein